MYSEYVKKQLSEIHQNMKNEKLHTSILYLEEDEIYDLIHNYIDYYISFDLSYYDMNKILYNYGFDKIYKEYYQEFGNFPEPVKMLDCYTYKILYNAYNEYYYDNLIELFDFNLKFLF
jgi:hypothetical protein